MTGPKTECRKKETEILRKEDEIKTELAEIVPLIRDLPPEAIDEELVEAIDQACKSARNRADQARSASAKVATKKHTPHPPSAAETA